MSERLKKTDSREIHYVHCEKTLTLQMLHLRLEKMNDGKKSRFAAGRRRGNCGTHESASRTRAHFGEVIEAAFLPAGHSARLVRKADLAARNVRHRLRSSLRLEKRSPRLRRRRDCGLSEIIA